MKSEQQIFDELAECNKDGERWTYLLENKAQENMPCLMLDNDDTYLRFSDNIIDTIDGTYVQFDNYAGWDDGLMELLTAIGIKHSAV